MNPFTLNYQPELFCDRDKETEKLNNNVINGLNTLLHGPRRLGKSALLHHLFYRYEKRNEYETLFVDLFASQNIEDLIRLFAESILEKYHKKNILSGIKKLLLGLSPSVSFSPDGTTKLSLSLSDSQRETTLQQLFAYLEKRNKKLVIAFDEIQEIANYPEKAEAMLRSHIQRLKNIQFIFSGSSNHILQEMFNSPQRPFYQSTEVMVLDKIDKKSYAEFINDLFIRYGKTIDQEAVDHILDFTEVYTYYTQVVGNQAFSKTDKSLNYTDATIITKDYIENRKSDYQAFLSLLPENQKKIAIAIAKEGIVKVPSAIDFIIKNHLPSASSTLLAVKALLNKEIIYKTQEGYVIYDIFFKRFLQMFY